jgi:hypothetical protein
MAEPGHVSFPCEFASKDSPVVQERSMIAGRSGADMHELPPVDRVKYFRMLVALDALDDPAELGYFVTDQSFKWHRHGYFP